MKTYRGGLELEEQGATRAVWLQRSMDETPLRNRERSRAVVRASKNLNKFSRFASKQGFREVGLHIGNEWLAERNQ